MYPVDGPVAQSTELGQIDVFEPGGQGGVFQHSLAACVAVAEAGYRVTLHTANDAEITDDRVNLCRCFSWEREAQRLRGVRITLKFLWKTAPHLIWRTGRNVWVQGLFKLPLMIMLLAVLRLSGKNVMFSPHNVFSRTGSYWEDRLIQIGVRTATHLIVYNSVDFSHDAALVSKRLQVPLLMYAPPVTQTSLDHWTRLARSQSIQVCSIGQLREDKNLDFLVRACQRAGLGLVIAGQDKGSLSVIRSAVNDAGSTVLIVEGFLPIQDLAGILSSVPVLALPYSVSSQSGAAGLAHAYGTTVLASDVGGLREQADRVVSGNDESEWSKQLTEASRSGVESRAHLKSVLARKEAEFVSGIGAVLR